MAFNNLIIIIIILIIETIKSNPKHLKTKSTIGPFRISEEIFNTSGYL